jgi:hypothetical protein
MWAITYLLLSDRNLAFIYLLQWNRVKEFTLCIYCNTVRLLDADSIQDGSLLLTNTQHYS